MILLTFNIALRTEGVTPVRAFDVAPPLIMIVEWHFVIGRRENHCTCHEILLLCSREFFFCGSAFSNCDVIRRPNELLKLRVGNRSRVHPESIYVNTMHRL